MAQVEFPNIDPVYPDGELYVVTHNSDLTEGRGREVDHSFWTDLDEAVEAAQGIDVMGTNGTVYRITQLLPEKRVKYWGREWNNEFRRNYEGFTPESGRWDEESIREILRKHPDYQKYLDLKAKFEPYGLA